MRFNEMEPQDTADDPPRYSFIDSRNSSPSDLEAKGLSKDIVNPPGYPPDLSLPRTEASIKHAHAGYADYTPHIQINIIISQLQDLR